MKVGVRKHPPFCLRIDLTLLNGERCLLYTLDAAEDLLGGDLGGSRIIKQTNTNHDDDTEHITIQPHSRSTHHHYH